MSNATLDSFARLTEVHARTLRGTFLTHIARGETQVPLSMAVKTARTYLGRSYVSPSALKAILDEVRAVGVDGFRDWATYDQRKRRLQALAEALFVMLAERSR